MALERARSALMFALAVAVAQAACLLVMWLLSLARAVSPTQPGSGRRPGLQLALFFILLAVPVFMPDLPPGRRWPPLASRQATIIFSMIGLTAGFLLGALLAENGYLASWTLGTLAGAVVGGFGALVLLNLFASGR